MLWTRADSREALISAFVAIATLINLPEKDAQEQMIAVNAVKAWLQKHTEWLLILDNADELAIIPEFLPPTYGGHILLTTRAHAMGRLAIRIEVDTLSPDMGAFFLLGVGLRKLSPGAKSEVCRVDPNPLERSAFYLGNRTVPHLSYKRVVLLCSSAFFPILCHKVEFRRSLFSVLFRRQQQAIRGSGGKKEEGKDPLLGEYDA